MSLVERLSRKLDEASQGFSGRDFEREQEARWWLNAIADEIEREWPGKHKTRAYAVDVTEWLQAEASDDGA